MYFCPAVGAGHVFVQNVLDKNNESFLRIAADLQLSEWQ